MSTSGAVCIADVFLISFEQQCQSTAQMNRLLQVAD